MYVIKRNGQRQPVHLDKITARLSKLCYGLSSEVDPVEVARLAAGRLCTGITTVELDQLTADLSASLSPRHPDYDTLAARVCVSNLHKTTPRRFSDVCRQLMDVRSSHDQSPRPVLSDEQWEVVQAHADELDALVVHARDFDLTYFAYRTLEATYLLRIGDQVVERPQHLLLRVAVALHGHRLDRVRETYELLSQRYYIHATPTLFNAGRRTPQLSSCYLLTMKGDSIEGIYQTLGQCAVIAKNAGGIGLSVTNVRASGSPIYGTGGASNGLVPMLRVFNASARYVDQGGGKRKGSIAIYLEPWHADIHDFLDLAKKHGNEERRARDLFQGLWLPDLFLERVRDDGVWSLFCPSETPDLIESFGDDFRRRYVAYEAQGKPRVRETLQARFLWNKIIVSQCESGIPYLLFKDACNAKSNQQHCGVLHGSNLCTEILQLSNDEEVAVCNLASLSLPAFLRPAVPGCAEDEAALHAQGNHTTEDRLVFDHAKLNQVVQVMTRNLNRVIDVTSYPLPEARRSNLRHRPMGLGVQGLANLFLRLGVSFTSPEARQLNREVFETLYFASLTASMELAREDGPYEAFAGSPASRGLLQFDLWRPEQVQLSDRWDWADLKSKIQQHGLRNSLLVAPMPTASTSQILGNVESIEALNSNLYVRRTLAGEFVCVVRELVTKLESLGLWTPDIRQRLLASKGSVQALTELPASVRENFRTVFEMSGRTLLDMAAERGVFIDQSQSLNLHIAEPTLSKVSSAHFHAWQLGLKGSYYLRRLAAVDPIAISDTATTASATMASATMASATMASATMASATMASAATASATTASATTASATTASATMASGGGGGGGEQVVRTRAISSVSAPSPAPVGAVGAYCTRDDPSCLACGS